MYYLDNGNIVTKMEDLRDQIPDDLYQAVEGIHQDKLEIVSDDLSIKTYERDLAEERLETCHMDMQDAYRALGDLETYIKTAKRLNRDKILDIIGIINHNIENSIDS